MTNRKPYFLVVLLCLIPASVRAQGDTDLAKGYYKLGVELYNRADYEEALVQFKKAFKYSGKAALLHNMARCYESLGRHEEAVAHYERYLEEGKPADAAMISARIGNLKRLIERKKTPAPKPAPVSASQPTPAPAPATKPAGSDTPKPPDKPTPAPAPSRSRPLRTTGWILVGVGAASLVAGIILGKSASDAASNLEDDNADKKGVEYADVMKDVEHGQSMQNAQIATLVVGGVAAAAGAVLLILDARRASTDRQAWLAPAITPGGAMVSGGLRF